MKNWSVLPETQNEVLNKMSFINNIKEVQKRRKMQRRDILNHHLSYYTEQANEESKTLSRNFQPNKVKLHKNGGPSKDRKLIDEPTMVTTIDVEQMREYSQYLCRKRLIKVENEYYETIEKIVLPYISSTFK